MLAVVSNASSKPEVHGKPARELIHPGTQIQTCTYAQTGGQFKNIMLSDPYSMGRAKKYQNVAETKSSGALGNACWPDLRSGCVYIFTEHIVWFTCHVHSAEMLCTCGMNIRRSWTMAWNHASTNSAWERDALPDLLTYSGLQASNVRSKFFFTPGGAFTEHTMTAYTPHGQ